MADRILTSDPVTEYRAAINEIFAAGDLVDRPAAADVPGSRYFDEFGTEWRSDGSDWLFAGGATPIFQGTWNVPSATDSTRYGPTGWTGSPTAFGASLTIGELYDPWTMHETGDGHLTVPYSGLWVIEMGWKWQTAGFGVGTGARYNAFAVRDPDGVSESLGDRVSHVPGGGIATNEGGLAWTTFLDAGAQIGPTFVQDSGVALSCSGRISAHMLSGTA